jgi:hypothetical protein
MSTDMLLLVLSVICLALAAFQVNVPRVNLQALGLLFFVLTFLI